MIGRAPRFGFVPATTRERIAPGQGTPVQAGGVAIALYDVGGRVLAIDDLCIRCGSSLAAGAQDAAIATCGRCGWRYDIVSGQVVDLPTLRLERFAVRIDGNEVLVAPRAAAQP